MLYAMAEAMSVYMPEGSCQEDKVSCGGPQIGQGFECEGELHSFERAGCFVSFGVLRSAPDSKHTPNVQKYKTCRKIVTFLGKKFLSLETDYGVGTQTNVPSQAHCCQALHS
jgi:hypothetical protein